MIHSRTGVYRGVSLLLTCAMLLGMAWFVQAPRVAEATHFRASSLTWERTAPRTVEFSVTVAARRSYPDYRNAANTALVTNPNVGAIITNVATLAYGDGGLGYGDGGVVSPAQLQFTVTSVDVANDVLIAHAHVSRTYAGTGATFTAFLDACCRLSAPRHRNNSDDNVRINSLVNLASTASVDSDIAPIVDCPKNAQCLFAVPAVAPAGQTVIYRLATSTEATGTSGFFQPGQVGQSPIHQNPPLPATINPTTGVYAWITTGAILAAAGTDSLFSSQVIITAQNSAGVIQSSVAVDFFIRLSDEASPDRPPVFNIPTPVGGTVLTTTVGDGPVTFSVAAIDPDTTDTVTLSMLGKPATATFTQTPGNPASGSFSWTPTVSGSAILTLEAKDQLGLGATARSVTILVAANQLPIVAANQGSVSVPEGTDATMAGTVSDANGDTVTVSASTGSVVNNGNGTWNWSRATTDGPANSNTVTITATDSRGGVRQTSFGVVVTNVAPSATWTIPAPVNEGDAISLALTNPSDPSSADTTAGFSYAFNCGSGYGAFGATSTASCPTADNGTRIVGGKIRDKDGGELEYTSSVSIFNVAPSAVFNATGADEGSAIAVSLTSPSDPSSVDTAAGFTYAFDCGSGFGSTGSTNTANCATTDNGTRTVGGKILDKDGGVSTYSSTVTVASVAPTATLTASSPVAEGSAIAVSLTSPSDPSSADTTAGFAYAFDCGSGYGAYGATSTANCPTTDNGSVSVRGTIRDKDGALTEYSTLVTVTNVAPTATFSAPSPASEGSSFTLTLTNPVDPSSADVAAGFSYAFDCGNGYAAASTSNSASCPTTDNGSITVRGTIIDKDLGETEYSSSVIVTNVAPTATFNAPSPVNEGSPISLSLSDALDPSSVDQAAGFSYAFDCGSGYSAFGTSSSASCPTTDNGVRSVAGTLRDQDGGERAYTASVTITNVAPTITSIAVSASSIATTTPVTFTGSLTDPGSADTHTWQWSVDSVPVNGDTDNMLTHTFTTCGAHTVTAIATDDDGGVSVPFEAAGVSIFEAHFLQPIDEGVYNGVQKGRVIPVKIQIGCNGTSIAGLTPAIKLLSGDISTTTEAGLDGIETLSVSAADTTGVMRSVDGKYLYNLQVPATATTGQYLTIRVRPFGDANPSAVVYAVLKIHK